MNYIYTPVGVDQDESFHNGETELLGNISPEDQLRISNCMDEVVEWACDYWWNYPDDCAVREADLTKKYHTRVGEDGVVVEWLLGKDRVGYIKREAHFQAGVEITITRQDLIENGVEGADKYTESQMKKFANEIHKSLNSYYQGEVRSIFKFIAEERMGGEE